MCGISYVNKELHFISKGGYSMANRFCNQSSDGWGMAPGMTGGWGANPDGWGSSQGGWGAAQGGWGNSPVRFPAQTHPTRYAPPQVAPTREFIKTNIFPTVVPHIQPSHTTTINRKVIENQFYFPHTESVINECCVKNTMCGRPHNPHHHHHNCGCGKRR